MTFFTLFIQELFEIIDPNVLINSLATQNFIYGTFLDFIDIKSISDFLKQRRVKEELLKHSLGIDVIDKRGERFFRIVSG